MMVYRTFTFRRIFFKKLYHIQVFDVRYKWWKRYLYRFQLSLSRKFSASTSLSETRLKRLYFGFNFLCDLAKGEGGGGGLTAPAPLLGFATAHHFFYFRHQCFHFFFNQFVAPWIVVEKDLSS